jgi:lipoprotein-anchoring transpeptidase ErfK/SrfK
MNRFSAFCGASALVLGLLSASGSVGAQIGGGDILYFAGPSSKPNAKSWSSAKSASAARRAQPRSARAVVQRARKERIAVQVPAPSVAPAQAAPAAVEISAKVADPTPAPIVVKRAAAVKTAAANPQPTQQSKTEARVGLTSAADDKDPLQLVVSIPDQRVAVYKGDKVVATSTVSTGRPSHPTPSGVFSIIGKERLHHSNLYESAPMPWMQRITWSGVALHAGNVSRPYASHGCIRLPYGFAQSLFKRTEMGAHVIVAAGMSAPEPIEHDVLPQPSPATAVTAVENVSTETAAHTDADEAGQMSDADSAGIPNFIPPVEAAANRLEEAKQAREDAEAAVPRLETALSAARDVAARQKASYEEARAAVTELIRPLADADAVVASARKALATEQRNLSRLQARAKWSQATVDKRRDDPRFEGDWMTTALARLAERQALVTAAEERTAAAQQAYDAAAAGRTAADEALKQARAKAAARADTLSEAEAGARRAEADLGNGKRAIVVADKDIVKATNNLRLSQQREKLPLRVLITPLNEAERIKVTQRLLAELGYEGVEPVGWLGKQTTTAIRAVERDMGVRETGKVSEELIGELYRRVGREPTNNAHLYVRQGFLDLFDLPVVIAHPETPLGTHVFTAMHFGDNDTKVEWTALTVRERSSHTYVSSGRKGKGSKTVINAPTNSAKEVLDRITIPDYARRQLSSMLTPGSSLVITDKGISRETGRGTDFVVLTR